MTTKQRRGGIDGRGRVYGGAAAVDEEADELAGPDVVDAALLRAQGVRAGPDPGAPAAVVVGHREVAPASERDGGEESRHQQRDGDEGGVSLLRRHHLVDFFFVYLETDGFLMLLVRFAGEFCFAYIDQSRKQNDPEKILGNQFLPSFFRGENQFLPSFVFGRKSIPTNNKFVPTMLWLSFDI